MRMTSDQILDLIATRIVNLYREPQMSVGDVGELDAVLFELHWLHAHASGTIDNFVSFFSRESKNDFLNRLEFSRSHRSLCEPGVASEIVEWWQRFDNSLGLNWATT
jgi:hypothetical protein